MNRAAEAMATDRPFTPPAPRPSHVEWSASTFDTNGLTLHYVHSSLELSSLPKLLFLHGLSQSGQTLIPLLSSFTDNFFVVLPDARAHGKSKPIPPNSFTMANLVADAIAIILHVSPSEPVYLAGHSMGAATAARVAKACPELVKAVILEDPPWLRMKEEPVNPAEYQKNPSEWCKYVQSLSDIDFSKINPVLPGNSSPLAITTMDAERALDVAAIEPTYRETEDLFNEAVNSLSMPVLLQSGALDSGSILRPKVAQSCLATFPNGRHKKYSGAHHVLHAHAPEEWLEDVRLFLEECRRACGE
eukprot:TRINITY_DN26484_c0_g1_i1.p1 TRINITY_DN26484_c0_g1~~TRINITY_DN26484_c0_g1_i1.p1  ORF type:complete len:303 (+),score=45.45 TRINITY_DN26484_c0_g1_i1:44-952(+)